MLKPTFRLTGKVKLNLDRYAPPSYVRGQLVRPAPTTVTIEANIQPLTKSNDTKFLPDSAQGRHVVILWSASEIRQRQEHNSKEQADQFVWQNRRYEVIRAVNYAMGVLNHWEAVAVALDPLDAVVSYPVESQIVVTGSAVGSHP